MPKKEVLYIVVGLFLSFSLSSCGRLFKPDTFVQTMEPAWAVIEVREGLTYEKAWSSVVDLLVKRFDLEMVSKDDGYARTAWLYTWTGKLNRNYRVRVILKFSADKINRCFFSSSCLISPFNTASSFSISSSPL